MKLTDTQSVLEWADSEYDDPETAARLALAMRVLERVEARANGAGYCTNGVCNYCPSVLDYCKHILAEASATEEKGNE